MDEKKNIIDEQQTQAIDNEATQIIEPDTTGIDVIDGVAVGETQVMDPVDASDDITTLPETDISPAPKRKRAAAIAAVAAVAIVAVVGVGAAIASTSADPGQQPGATSSSASSSTASTKASKSASSSASSKAADEKKDADAGSGQEGSSDQQEQPTSGDAGHQDSGQAASGGNSGGGSGNGGGGSSEPQKRWVDEVGHNEQVLVQDAWDEPVYETVGYQYCQDCGCRVDSPIAHCDAAPTKHHSFTVLEERVQVDTIHHAAVYDTVYVVDVPGHWE